MERVFSAAPLFFGATREAPTTARDLFGMADPVDGNILREAVEKAIRRFPYLAVRAELEDGWYVLRDNPAPVPVYEAKTSIPLGGEAARGHLIAARYHGNELCFDMFHGLTDGFGYLRFLRTVFYYYCTRKYGPLPHRDGVLLQDDPIPSEEALDPYPDAVDESIRPMGRYVSRGAVQLFPAGAKKGTWHSVIRLPERAFVRFSKQQDGSPATMAALLMARAVRAVLGETELPIVCGLAMDMRPVLRKPISHHSVVTQLFLEYGPRMEKLDLSLQATAFRGMVILQSQPENVLTSVRNNIRFIQKLGELPDLAARRAYMQGVLRRSMQADTFKVSYAGDHGMGPSDPYIRTCNPFIDIHGAGAMLELSAFGGYIDVNFLQESDDARYLEAFLRELQDAGVEAEASALKPFSMANIDFCGTGEKA